MVAFSPASSLLNCVQKQYCAVIKKKKKTALAMNCNSVLSGLLNQTATTLLKLPKTWDLVLLARTPSRKTV